MELDTRTTIVASLVVAALLGAVALAFGRGEPAARALRLWGVALLAIALGLAGVALRGTIPDFASIVLANTLICAALVVSYRSLVSFRRAPGGDALGWGLVAATFAALWLFTEVWPDLRARIMVLSGVRAFLLARNALELGHNVPADCRLSFNFTRGVFWFAAVTMVVRGALMMGQPPMADFLAPNPVHAVPYLIFACVSASATLGVFWIVVQLLQRDLLRLATRDALTDILNRAAFLAEFEREASRSQRGGAAFSLAIFDLDRFKALNDRYGHPAGDEVLRRAAATMRQCLRRHDVLGRCGGEEFALLMPDTDKQTATLVAERIRAAVERMDFARDGERVALSLSGGVATRGADGEDWERLFATADRALYAAKSAGRNRIVASSVPLGEMAGSPASA